MPLLPPPRSEPSPDFPTIPGMGSLKKAGSDTPDAEAAAVRVASSAELCAPDEIVGAIIAAPVVVEG